MKNSIFLLVIITSQIPLFGQIPANGLVAYFPFQGNAKDSSPYHTHGVVHGATLTSDRNQNANSAYHFDGNTYISFPTTNVLNNRYTYSIWANIQAPPTYGDMTFALNIGSQNGDQSLNTGLNAYSLNGWLGGGYNTVSPNFALNDNQAIVTGKWRHIICVRDSTYAKLYVDCILVDSLGSSTIKYPSYGTKTIGAFIGIRNIMQDGFVGDIDDVCIYNRALTYNEVQQLCKKVIYEETQIAELKLNTMQIYPNPNSGDFVVGFAYPIGLNQLKVKIYGVNGEEMKFDQTIIDEKNIKISNSLPSGIYQIVVYDGVATKSTTIIINR